jgi:hypothetical protein
MNIEVTHSIVSNFYNIVQRTNIRIPIFSKVIKKLHLYEHKIKNCASSSIIRSWLQH